MILSLVCPFVALPTVSWLLLTVDKSQFYTLPLSNVERATNEQAETTAACLVP